MFEAIINVPGYLPMADSPALFFTEREAWDWLLCERHRALDDVDYDEPENDEDSCLEELAGYVDSPACGTVWGRTPGYDGEHDLGLAYSVVQAGLSHVDYPHLPGYLYDCQLCESRCFCDGDPGHTECVYCAIQQEGESCI